MAGMGAIIKQGERECTDLDTSKHFRFINTMNGVYDLVAMSTTFGDVKVGHTILLDDTNYPMAYVGLDDATVRKPQEMAAHKRTRYIERIQQLLSMGSCIPLSKWPTGHWCKYNDEVCALCFSVSLARFTLLGV